MALTTQTMTDEQRKSVALEYLKAFDNGGVTSTGGSILDLFADDAQVYFPKWGLASGKKEIGKLFGDVGESRCGGCAGPTCGTSSWNCPMAHESSTSSRSRAASTASASMTR